MLLETRELTKSFSGKTVLRGVNLSAQAGRALGFLGRNGAGKTTTLRILMDVFAPDSGQVLLDGEPLRRDKLRIGYMPEERGLYPKHRIDEQLLYLAALKGTSRADAQQTMRRLLEQLGIADAGSKRLDTLSKGNQQKVQLVATLISEPDIVLLDEPFSGLDPVNALVLKQIVHEQIEKGRIVLFSSHQMHYVEEFCDDVAILHEGKIARSGTLEQIKQGHARNRLWVRAADLAPVRDFITAQLSWMVESMEEKDGALLLTLHQVAFTRAVMQALVAEPQLDLDGIDVWQPALSDIFVEVTEGGV